MKVLILGGTWFIGKHLTYELLKYNYEVWHFNRGKNPINNVNLIKGDRFNDDTKLLLNHKFDSVVDLTCFSETDFYNTYAFLQNNFKQYIFLTTLNYSDTKFYKNKKAAENLIKKLNNYVVIKTKNVVGEDDYSNRFYKKNNKWYLKSTKSQLSISSYIEVEFLASVIREIIENKFIKKIFAANQRRGYYEIYE